jgi:hypothetical protein
LSEDCSDTPATCSGDLKNLGSTLTKWTNNMSCDMIHLDSFFDAPRRDLVAPDDPRTRKRLQASFNGRDNIVTIPKFCIHH